MCASPITNMRLCAFAGRIYAGSAAPCMCTVHMRSLLFDVAHGAMAHPIHYAVAYTTPPPTGCCSGVCVCARMCAECACVCVCAACRRACGQIWGRRSGFAVFTLSRTPRYIVLCQNGVPGERAKQLASTWLHCRCRLCAPDTYDSYTYLCVCVSVWAY